MDYAAWNILPCHRRWVVKGSVGFIPVLKDGAFSLILRKWSAPNAGLLAIFVRRGDCLGS
ncbi:MAG: hypothetical protein ACI8VE_002265 [Natrialbaceae archaeon]|jgi:hypothetical protein